MRSDTPTIRPRAVIALGRLGAAAKSAIPALTERAARDHAEPVRAAAIGALEAIAQGSSASVPDLVGRDHLAELLRRHRSEDGRVRASTTWDMAAWGPAADGLVPTLAHQLAHDEHSDARWAAAWALGRTRSGDQAAVRGLGRAALDDPDPDIRAEAVRALGWIGPAAQSAVAEMVEACTDSSALVREESATAIGRIGSTAPEAVTALRGALSDGHEPVRRRAAAALSELGVTSGGSETW